MIPPTLKGGRLVRRAEDEEPGVMQRFDQPIDEWIDEPRVVLGLVGALKPAPDAARPRALADSRALGTRAVQRDEYPGPVQLARQTFCEGGQRGVT